MTPYRVSRLIVAAITTLAYGEVILSLVVCSVWLVLALIAAWVGYFLILAECLLCLLWAAGVTVSAARFMSKPMAGWNVLFLLNAAPVVIGLLWSPARQH